MFTLLFCSHHHNNNIVLRVRKCVSGKFKLETGKALLGIGSFYLIISMLYFILSLMQKHLRINNRIRIEELQVIDENGNQIGKMKTFDALKLARERELDLVEVGPNMKPPIAKIMDYGKYMYRKEKQEKSSGAKKTKDHDMKTVRIGFKTGEHDLKFKAKKADEFLKDGHSVKVEIILRGRERALAHIGRDRVDNFLKIITEPHILQDTVKRSPRGWSVLVQKEKK
jgi:translation initiation factor IF-3